MPNRAITLASVFAVVALGLIAVDARRVAPGAPTVPADPVPKETGERTLHPFSRGHRRRQRAGHEATASQEPGDRGRAADSPAEMPATGWKDILIRTYQSISGDRVFALSAGVTYYILLSLFPALAALVSIFGLFGDVAVISNELDALDAFVPATALDIMRQQLARLTAQGGGALGFAFVTGLLMSLWTANASTKALFDALNVVYAEREKRKFFTLNAFSLLFTFGLLAFTILAIMTVIILPTVLNWVFLGRSVELAISILRWPAMYVVVLLGLSVVYRYGPSRADAKWRWVTWGSALAALLWMIASIGFSWYVANFASYNETYGSLGAVIGFMVWAWLSVGVVLLGGELNAEIEHQTARDTTTGRPRPIGQRGAVMADTVGAAQG